MCMITSYMSKIAIVRIDLKYFSHKIKICNYCAYTLIIIKILMTKVLKCIF